MNLSRNAEALQPAGDGKAPANAPRSERKAPFTHGRMIDQISAEPLLHRELQRNLRKLRSVPS